MKENLPHSDTTSHHVCILQHHFNAEIRMKHASLEGLAEACCSLDISLCQVALESHNRNSNNNYK